MVMVVAVIAMVRVMMIYILGYDCNSDSPKPI